MKKKTKRKGLILWSILVPTAIGTIIFCRANSAQAETAQHIIINEIQTASANSNDEFVELFNPTDTPIDLDGYKLGKKTKTGSSESSLVSATKFSGTIEARGYFLIAHPDCKDKISADLPYSGSTYYISNDNTVLLYGKDGTLLDKVGFGTASDFESNPATNPDASQSISRTYFIDTNDNAADFSINIFPSPQNSSIFEKDSEEFPAGGESPEGAASNDENLSGENEPPEEPGDNGDVSPNESDFCVVTSPDIRLNEIFPFPEKGEEFVEVVNRGESCVDISGWKIMDGAGHKKEFPEKAIIHPGEYLVLEGNLYLNNDSDTVYLLGKNGDSKNEALDSQNFEKTRKSLSYSFDVEDWQWTSIPTPGEKNVITTSDSSESKSDTNSEKEYSSDENIYLNEIFSNPKNSSDNEYIEIASGESGPVDLQGWMIRDGSKSGKYIFEEHFELGPGEYFVIYKSESKIALNNSGESIYLFNPAGKIVSRASFEKSQKNASYNFDGNEWKWSKYLTPGKKNKFDSAPSVKIKKPARAYQNILMDFSAAAKDKETRKLKYAWDFGDGKKSYLAKTSHKYLDTGKYIVTLSVSDDSQTIEKSFTVTVKKYPQPDLEIVKIVPNPVGNDLNGEYISVKNNSRKKVDFRDWKIATGSGNKIYNHPISDGITLGQDETKTITREMSKFSLNNKSGNVQLLSPDEKIVDEVEYSKEKIAEGESYTKTNGKWRWVSLPDSPRDEEKSSEKEDSEENSENKVSEGEILGATDKNIPRRIPLRTRYTPEDEFIFLKIFGLLSYKPQEINYCPINEVSASFATL